MPTWNKPSPRPNAYYCDSFWHLRTSGNLLSTYDLIGKVTHGGETEFFGTAANVARYFYPDKKDAAFGSVYETVRRNLAALRKLGWLKMRDNRHMLWVPHEEWAKDHPGKCFQRIVAPWQENTDALVKKLYALSGGKLRVLEHHMAGIRKFGTDEEIQAEFKKAMERSAELRSQEDS
jgi:hypothetical protein